MNFNQEFKSLIDHEKGKHFLLDFGGAQAAVSIFAYAAVLNKTYRPGLRLKILSRSTKQ